MRIRVRILLFLLMLTLAASLAIGGYGKGIFRTSPLRADTGLFSEALAIIRSDYVDEVEPKKLIYGAMRGMITSLDDFSDFLEPDEYNEMAIEAKGEFGGIGVEISMKDGILTVIAPLAGAPAEEAGIKPGDRIIRINGKSTKKIKISDAVKEMRGLPGTTVTLTVWRENLEKVLDIPIRRAIIKLKSVKDSRILGDNTGYIKLAEFQEGTPRELDEALKKLSLEGMDSLILDLRNNPGGLLDTAIDVSERFLPEGKTIVSIKSRNLSQDAVLKSRAKVSRFKEPLIVMVNEGSASGSEIVAGAIQDNRRGIVLGAKTFGKASVQAVIPLRDGSALKLTTASYVTPGGKMIRNHGIIPDVIMETEETKGKKSEPADIFEKMEKNAQAAAPVGTPSKETAKDDQLDTALKLIKAIKLSRT